MSATVTPAPAADITAADTTAADTTAAVAFVAPAAADTTAADTTAAVAFVAPAPSPNVYTFGAVPPGMGIDPAKIAACAAPATAVPAPAAPAPAAPARTTDEIGYYCFKTGGMFASMFPSQGTTCPESTPTSNPIFPDVLKMSAVELHNWLRALASLDTKVFDCFWVLPKSMFASDGGPDVSIDIRTFCEWLASLYFEGSFTATKEHLTATIRSTLDPQFKVNCYLTHECPGQVALDVVPIVYNPLTSELSAVLGQRNPGYKTSITFPESNLVDVVFKASGGRTSFGEHVSKQEANDLKADAGKIPSGSSYVVVPGRELSEAAQRALLEEFGTIPSQPTAVLVCVPDTKEKRDPRYWEVEGPSGQKYGLCRSSTAYITVLLIVAAKLPIPADRTDSDEMLESQIYTEVEIATEFRPGGKLPPVFLSHMRLFKTAFANARKFFETQKATVAPAAAAVVPTVTTVPTITQV